MKLFTFSAIKLSRLRLRGQSIFIVTLTAASDFNMLAYQRVSVFNCRVKRITDQLFPVEHSS